MQTVIIMESSIKMAKQHATNTYGLGNWIYIKPFKYASKGNNFYEFNIISHPDITERDTAYLPTVLVPAVPRPAHRPVLPPGKATIKRTVCLTPAQIDELQSKYGTLSAAIRNMLKGGQYEALQARYESVLAELAKIRQEAV